MLEEPQTTASQNYSIITHCEIDGYGSKHCSDLVYMYLEGRQSQGPMLTNVYIPNLIARTTSAT